MEVDLEGKKRLDKWSRWKGFPGKVNGISKGTEAGKRRFILFIYLFIYVYT